MPETVSFADLLQELDAWHERGVWFMLDPKTATIGEAHKPSADITGLIEFMAANHGAIRAYLIFRDEPKVRGYLEFDRWMVREGMMTEEQEPYHSRRVRGMMDELRVEQAHNTECRQELRESDERIASINKAIAVEEAGE